MRRRVEARLRKAIRAAGHRICPGLPAAVASRERQWVRLAEALCRLAVDPGAQPGHRQFAADLLVKTRGVGDFRPRMVSLVASFANNEAKSAYFNHFYRRRDIHPMELELFQDVMARGTPEEQVKAISAVAFVDRRPVRRALIAIMEDCSASLAVREQATEMLHCHKSLETAQACARAMADPNPVIRFWAAYTLGQVTRSGSSFRQVSVAALQQALDDHAIAPGWWSVGREAQASIAGLRDPGEWPRLQAEIRRVQQDPAASAEDHAWADCYCT